MGGGCDVGLCRDCVLLWTYQRNKVWSNELTFWADAAKKSPKKARPQVNLGVALQERARLKQTIGHYSKAMRIKLNDEVARRNKEKLSCLMKKSPFQGRQTDYTETHEKDR
jgi:hypothetical protein